MIKSVLELIEVSSSEAGLEQYQRLYSQVSWDAEIKRLLDANGKMNIAALALKGLGDGISPAHDAFIISSPTGVSTISRRDLEEAVRRLAGGLKERHGIKPGEAAAIFLPNGREMVISILALIYIGAVAAPIIDIYKAEPVRSRLTNLKPRLLITAKGMLETIGLEASEFVKTTVTVENGFAELLKSAPAEPLMMEPGAPYIVHYTSGTYGTPKGIVHAHGGAAGAFRTAEWTFSLRPGKRIWVTGHPGWLPASVYGIFGALFCGAASVLHSGKIDTHLLGELKPTAVYAIPSLIGQIMAGGATATDFSSIEVLASTGERLSPTLAAQVKQQAGIDILGTFCMTETGMIMISDYPFAPLKGGSVGMNVPGLRAIIINENDVELPPNTLGILAFERGWPSMMYGIYGDGRGIDDAFSSKHFVTTDYAYRDDDGYFWVLGRGEEFIKRGSERISPFELEDVLLTHAAVGEVAAIQFVKDGREHMKVFAVLAAGFEAGPEIIASMKDHVRDNMGAYAVPDDIEFMDELPKTRTGKVLRRNLKAKEQNLPEE